MLGVFPFLAMEEAASKKSKKVFLLAEIPLKLPRYFKPGNLQTTYFFSPALNFTHTTIALYYVGPYTTHSLPYFTVLKKNLKLHNISFRIILLKS